jgi:hypothetical protein
MQPVGGNPSYDQLLAENRQLKQQLAQRQATPAGIQVDIERDQLSLNGLKTEEVQIDELRVSVAGLKKLVPELIQVSALANSSGQVKMPDLTRFSRFPMRVESMDLKLTEKTLNKVLSQTPVEGMSDLRIQVGQGGRLKLSGFAHKLIPVPFQVEGRVSAAGGSKLRFDLEKTKIAGFLPLPNLMTNLFASLASREMAAMNVVQRGDSYTVDLKSFVPENIQMQIDEIQTQSGQIRVRTGLDR